jgi:hypothetical protein
VHPANWRGGAVASSVEFGLTRLQPCRTALFSTDHRGLGPSLSQRGQWLSEMSAPSVSVTPRPGGRLVFDVIVRDALGESRHQVTMQANEAERWAKLGAEPARVALKP